MVSKIVFKSGVIITFLFLFFCRGFVIVNEKRVMPHINRTQYSFESMFRVPETSYYCILADTTSHMYKNLYICKDSLLLLEDRYDPSVTIISLYKDLDCDHCITMSSDSIFFKGHRKNRLLNRGEVECQPEVINGHAYFECDSIDGTIYWYPSESYVRLLLPSQSNSIFYQAQHKNHDAKHFVRLNLDYQTSTYGDERSKRHSNRKRYNNRLFISHPSA